MSDKPLQRPDFVDELEEGVKDIAQTAKKQIQAKQVSPSQDDTGQQPQQEDKANKKVDPVTGKPQPSKKMLTQLNQQVAQLAQMRIKKVREELEKQRLKVKESAESAGQAKGPEIKPEPEKAKEDIVAKTLKASKSTGEFKGLIGG